MVLMLVVGTLGIVMPACGRQASEDVFTQLSARLDQLEQKMVQLDQKDGELTELANDAKATSIKLEEKIVELGQQLEKLAARPSAPAAGKPAPSPADVSAGKKHHIVARGETLYSIARRYGRSVDELRRLNNLSQGQTIQAGQKLLVAPEGR
jgi:small-conductance mechanosensitive channel